ncbi:DNA methyltransferase, partial [Mycoplasma sp. 4423]
WKLWCFKEFNSNWERERERAGLTYNYDVIYIDPPYNTESSLNDGNKLANDKENVAAKRFIYRDKYTRNGWLNMMNERLKLAKKLLKDDGVIFVSIDDNEQAYLKVLMDEIFGEENFVSCFIWQKKSGGGLNSIFYEGHEYILVYTKNIKNISLSAENNTLSGFRKYRNKNGDDIYINDDIIRNQFGKKDGTYKHRNKAYEDLSPKQKEEWDKLIDDVNFMLVPFKKFPGKHLVAKIFNNERKAPYSIIKLPYTFISGIWTKDGNNDISEVNLKFPTPKPIELIKYLISLINKSNSRILDFYAGSGTTGHAVLELNKSDGGNRSYTLVTNNENNIAIDVNYERLYRINKGVGTKGESFEWVKNEPYQSNLNVFEIEHIDINPNTKQDTKEIIEKLLDVLKDFGINNLNINNESDEKNLLNDLLALNPQNITNK